MTTRHELLAEIHRVIKPTTYLEIGIQYGTSLNLSKAPITIGVDPMPLCPTRNDRQVYAVTSDEYFQYYVEPRTQVDLGFIDGSHRFEDALRDFINIERYSHVDTVVVFDDMLPRAQEWASRYMVPGHWTGDVWKIHPILKKHRPDLAITLLDTEPSGVMVVSGLNPQNTTLAQLYPTILEEWVEVETVPEDVLSRDKAYSPDEFIQEVQAAL